jgi:hypothetical protein
MKKKPRKICHQTFFDNDNMTVIHVFIKQIFSAADKAPPLLAPPTVPRMGWGSSGSLQPEAVSLVMAMKQ